MMQVPAGWKLFRTVQVIYLVMAGVLLVMDIIGLLALPAQRLANRAFIFSQLLFLAGVAAVFANLFFNFRLLRVIKAAEPPLRHGLALSRSLLVLFLLINALLALAFSYGVYDEFFRENNFRSRNDITISRLLLFYVFILISSGFYIAVRQIRLLWQYNSYKKKYFSNMVEEIGSR